MISVVVCTYNRSDILNRMLASFFEQTCLDAAEYELLVVDNNSTDDTRQVVEQFKHHPALQYIFEPRQGLSCARNHGVAKARGEIVSFLDDDVIVDANWLRNLQNCFNETKADVVGGRSYLIFEAPPPKWLGPELRGALSEVDLGRARKFLPDGRRLYGLNLSFCKAAIEAYGKFDERLGRTGSQLIAGEETAAISYIQDSGGIIVYEPDVIVGHIISSERLRWSYFKKLALEEGRTAGRTEAAAGRLRQLRKVLAASYHVLKGTIVFFLVRLSRDSYRHRLALRALYFTCGLLAKRCKRLLWHR